MELLDYHRCFAINSSARDGEKKNTCRAQLLARCDLTHKNSGQIHQFFLGKECIGEYMYQERGIAQVPTSKVCVIFSEGDSSLLKKFANHDDDVVQSGEMSVPRRGFDGSAAAPSFLPTNKEELTMFREDEITFHQCPDLTELTENELQLVNGGCLDPISGAVCAGAAAHVHGMYLAARAVIALGF